MIFILQTTATYLPRSKVAAMSVKLHHPDSLVVLMYFERELRPAVTEYPFFDSVLLAKDILQHQFETLLFPHRVYPAQSVVRPFLLQYMLQAYPDQKIVCIGSDMKLYGPLTELEQALDDHPIVLTPHGMDVISDDMFLFYGLFNGDMIALKNSDDAHRFLAWWGKRLEKYCYDSIEEGIYYDQAWLKFVPVYFNAHILKHPGYNIALWNLHEPSRNVSLGDGFAMKAGSHDLRLFHFSHVNTFLKHRVEGSKNPVLNYIYQQYLRELEALGGTKEYPWSYDRFDSGEFIAPETRDLFFKSDLLKLRFPYPFRHSNAEIGAAAAEIRARSITEEPGKKRRKKHKGMRRKRKIRLSRRKLQPERSRRMRGKPKQRSKRSSPKRRLRWARTRRTRRTTSQ